MSGGISQLVAIGAQDAFLTGNPEISFFRSTYKRHTNFSHVTTRQVIQGNPSNNAMSTVRFERKGDLLNHVYILSTTTSGVPKSIEWSSTSNLASVELLIGGQVIDTQYPDFAENIAPYLLAQNLAKSASGNRSSTSSYCPLRFSFFENCQSAIPLVALQYHDVEIRINWGSSIDADTSFEVYADFVYLDTEERQLLLNNPQNILMTQVQKAVKTNNKLVDLSFNHPIKYLTMSNTSTDSSTIFDSSAKIKLQINGVDIDDFKHTMPHFASASCYYHAPFSTGVDTELALIPFCLDTSKIQPTGSLNFSRLDSARLMCEGGANVKFDKDFYGVNYNVLRIQNGMGGLMFAN